MISCITFFHSMTEKKALSLVLFFRMLVSAVNFG